MTGTASPEPSPDVSRSLKQPKTTARTRERQAEYRERKRGGPPHVPMNEEVQRHAHRKSTQEHRNRKAAAEGRVRKHIGSDAEIKARRAAIVAIVEEQRPITVRGVYYLMTVQNLIPKTDAGYTIIMRDLVKLRRSGQVAYDDLIDNTRAAIIPYTCRGVTTALHDTVANYRRPLWDDTEAVVVVTVEKDALAGVISPVTNKYDVPLWPMRGFGSLTFLYSMAMSLADEDRPIYVYHFGDYDPSGVCAPEKIEAELRQHLPDADLHFKTVAVTPEQITKWNLPTRETKKSDSHAAAFGDDRSVELDAITPNRLRALVQECIARHMSEEQYAALMVSPTAQFVRC